jgi:hypothetical protein
MCECEEKVLNALKNGQCIRAIGGAVYDSNMNYLCVTSDLYDIARKYGIVRADSGGNPTWKLKTNGTRVAGE